MTIKVPISAETSGLKAAFADIENAVKGLNKTMDGGGKIKIDPASAKASLAEIGQKIEALNKQIENLGDADLGNLGIEGMADQLEATTKGASDLVTAMEQVGIQGASGFKQITAEASRSLRELERARRLQQVLKREGQTVPAGQALAAEREFQRRVSAGVPGSRKFKNNKGLGDVVDNWRDLAMNEVDARRSRRAILHAAGLGGAAGGGAGGGGGGGAGGGGGGVDAPAPGGGRRSLGGFLGDSMARGGRGMLGQVMPNTGVGGQIMHHGVTEAAASEGGMLSAGGMGRIAGGLGIGMAVMGGMKAIGAVRAKLGSAEEEATGFGDMTRSMGAATVDFDALRDAVRSATDGLGVLPAEAQKMAKEYAKQAGNIALPDLRNEQRSSAQFARGMGLDADQTSDFFGTMRHNKITKNDGDNKKLMLTLGDAIGKAGAFQKMDQVMAAIAGFASQATRASLSPANVSGFAGGMSSLLGLGQAGLDPAAAASILGRADSAIRSGGGMAQQNFMLGSAQKDMPGLLATDVGFLRDGGAFGTAESAFGEGSMAQKMAANDPALLAKYKTMAAQGGSTTNIERFMKGAKGQNAAWTKENMKGLFGMSDTEAAAMMAADANGGIGKSLQGMIPGGDISKVHPGSIKALMTTQYGNDGDRRRQASSLQSSGTLSNQEAETLAKAMKDPGKDDKNLKQVLAELLATRDMEKNEGDKTRESIVKMDKTLTEFASKLIPIANSIREGVVWLAKVMPGFEDKYGNSEQRGKTLAAAMDGAGGSASTRTRLLQEEMKEVNGPNAGKYTDEYRKQVGEQLKAAEKESPAGAAVSGDFTPGTNGVISPRDLAGGKSKLGVTVKPYTAAQTLAYAKKTLEKSEYDGVLRQAAIAHGLSFDEVKAKAVQESGLNAGAEGPLQTDGKQALGLMQIEKGNLSRMGVKNWRNPLENAMAGAKLLADAKRRAGGDSRRSSELYYAGLPQNIGPNSLQYGENSEAVRAQIERMRGAQSGDTTVPQGSAMAPPVPGSPGKTSMMFQHEIMVKLLDQQGKALAQPFTVSRLGEPAAAGGMR